MLSVINHFHASNITLRLKIFGKAFANKWLIFIGAGILVLLINLDATIINLALPMIGHQFAAPLSQLKWVINIYLLASSSFFLVGGRLSELVGYRTIFLVGAILFGVASLIAGLALNLPLLLFARALQGIGFALTLSQAFTLIAESFPREQQGLAVGLSIIITGLGLALGPTIGGVMLSTWDWIGFF